jgi:putative membrane protein
MVSDGAEDEFLLPILQSRLPIDGVYRIHVRQAANLESTYYTMVRALKDPKFRSKTILPFAFVLLTLALAAAAGVVWWGVVLLLFILGVYLIFWTFDIDEAIIDSLRSASSDIRQGSVAFGFGLLAIALTGVGFLEGYNKYIGQASLEPIARVLLFLQFGLVWWFLAGELWESGRALRRYLAIGRIGHSYPIATISIVGVAFISFSIVAMIQYLESLAQALPLPLIIGGLVLGFALMVSAAVLSQYFKTPSEEPPTEAVTTS